MGFFRNLLAGGPTYMDQNLFNTIVFKTYARFRPQFPDMKSFWRGEEVQSDGKIVETQELFKHYAWLYKRDDLLKSQFGSASLLLEEHLEDEFGLTIVSWQLVDSVATLSDDLDADGNKIVSTIHINAPSHPDPEIRPEQLVEDFKKYTVLVNDRIRQNSPRR